MFDFGSYKLYAVDHSVLDNLVYKRMKQIHLQLDKLDQHHNGFLRMDQLINQCYSLLVRLEFRIIEHTLDWCMIFIGHLSYFSRCFCSVFIFMSQVFMLDRKWYVIFSSCFFTFKMMIYSPIAALQFHVIKLHLALSHPNHLVPNHHCLSNPHCSKKIKFPQRNDFNNINCIHHLNTNVHFEYKITSSVAIVTEITQSIRASSWKYFNFMVFSFYVRILVEILKKWKTK